MARGGLVLDPVHTQTPIRAKRVPIPEGPWGFLERQFLVDNLLVRIHLIIVMILVDRPCAMGV